MAGTAAATLVVPSRSDSIGSSDAANLRYVSDDEPGIRRRRAGRGFAYIAPDGTLVRDPATLARIRALAIPPAYTDVWICTDPAGHIQSTGRDDRGRKQYVYHTRWREARDTAKYDRLGPFGLLLPRVRAATATHLALPGLPRDKVLALVVTLLERARIRVGNDAYRRDNGSYGLTTMLNRHAAIEGSEIRFHFRGKSGKFQRIRVNDRQLARVVRQCQELPGQQLFQYRDDAGDVHAIDSADVNAYLREVSSEEITAKDFRTWAGSCLALELLLDSAPAESLAVRKRTVTGVVAVVAAALGNTPAVCRASYIHPLIFGAYLDGTLGERVRPRPARTASSRALSPTERALLALIDTTP